MKRLLYLTAAIVCFGIAPAISLAETTLKFSGQVRTRFEVDGKSFGLLPTSSYTDMRTRFGVTADIDSSVHAFIQLQDSRRLGAFASDRPATSTATSTANVDLHQAWLAVDNFPVRNLRLQAGRFEMSFGNERVIGAVDWHNVARAFEGVSFSFNESNCLTHLFALQHIESTSGKLKEDYRMYGANVALTKTRLEFLWLYEDDSDTSYVSHDRMDRMSMGVYYNRTSGRSDITVNGVYQFGGMRLTKDQSISTNISAHMIAAEYGLSFPSPTKPRLAVGFDYTSGDDDTLSGDMTSYDNLYYTGHKYRGFMDYFLSSNVVGYRGLVDVMLRAKIEPTPGWTLKGDIHRFTTAVESSEKLGWEFDLITTITKVKGMKFELGAATFLPSDSYAKTSFSDNGYWMYASASVDF